MNWQYSTILFEFQKDGLLGDRYIDDEEMEKVLNEQGRLGWELVSVTPVQEGLLSFFKRALPALKKTAPPPSPDAPSPSAVDDATPGRPAGKPRTAPPKETLPQGKKQADKPGAQQDVVGDIKIR